MVQMELCVCVCFSIICWGDSGETPVVRVIAVESEFLLRLDSLSRESGRQVRPGRLWAVWRGSKCTTDIHFRILYEFRRKVRRPILRTPGPIWGG